MSSWPDRSSQKLHADHQPQRRQSGARNHDRLLLDRIAACKPRSNDLAQNRGWRKQLIDGASGHFIMGLAEHSLGRLAGHEQPAGIVEKQHAFFQALQQLLDVGAQFAGVLFGAAVLLVQQTQFGMHVGELAGFAASLGAVAPNWPVRIRSILWLTRCKGSMITLGSTAPRTIATHSAKRERQHQTLQRRLHGMPQ